VKEEEPIPGACPEGFENQWRTAEQIERSSSLSLKNQYASA